VSTTFGITQVPVAMPERFVPVNPDTKKRNLSSSSYELYDNIVGVTGVIVTLSVILSGVYVFCRFLI